MATYSYAGRAGILVEKRRSEANERGECQPKATPRGESDWHNATDRLELRVCAGKRPVVCVASTRAARTCSTDEEAKHRHATALPILLDRANNRPVTVAQPHLQSAK